MRNEEMGLDDDCLDIIKDNKKFWVEHSTHGDMPPTVFVFRKGFLCSLVSPKIDKALAFNAVKMARQGLGAESVVVALDAYKYEGKENHNREDVQNRFPPGTMQRLFQEGDPDIIPCLICSYVTSTGYCEMQTLPYDYRGEGTVFRWTESRWPKIIHGQDGGHLEGTVPEVLIAEMKSDTTLRKELKQIGHKRLRMSKRRTEYHLDKAVYSILADHDFVVYGRLPDMQLSESELN